MHSDQLPPQARANGGFTLVEVVIALLLVAIALTMTLPLLVEQPRIQARLEAKRDALIAIEGGLEAVRAGALPLVPGTIQIDDTSPELFLTVEPNRIPDLYDVTVEARWTLQNRDWKSSISTRVWRP